MTGHVGGCQLFPAPALRRADILDILPQSVRAGHGETGPEEPFGAPASLIVLDHHPAGGYALKRAP